VSVAVGFNDVVQLSDEWSIVILLIKFGSSSSEESDNT
jgi:hypothetical protein